MSKTGRAARYELTLLDEEGNVVQAYQGKNDLSFTTATDLLVSFRVFKVMMHVLGFLVGMGIYRLIFSLM